MFTISSFLLTLSVLSIINNSRNLDNVYIDLEKDILGVHYATDYDHERTGKVSQVA